MYSATKRSDGLYDIFQNGNRIGTGSASGLATYGLSPTNLGSAPTPQAKTYIPPAPAGATWVFGPNGQKDTATPAEVSSYLSHGWTTTLPTGYVIGTPPAGTSQTSAPSAAGTGSTGPSSGPSSGSSPSTGSHYGYDPSQPSTSREQEAFVQNRYIGTVAGTENIIGDAFLENLLKDSSLMAFYIHAIAYGGYKGEDVLRDMKRRELVEQGNTAAKTLKIIDPEMTKTQYALTDAGKAAASSTVIPNVNIGKFADSKILSYGLDMPDELFETLVPLLNPKSQEFKDAVAQVKSLYFDMVSNQLQAETEQEKAVADYNYKEFKRQMQESYGILLSDDATKAWAQIESLENTYNKSGISGSGMEAESIDETLRATRKMDQRARLEKLTKEEAQKAAYYTSSATAEEIAALTPEERAKWGLSPSADVLARYDINTLRSLYPNETEERLLQFRNAVLDEHGNYRSTLYSKYYSDVLKNKTEQKTSAETEVTENALADESRAYANVDDSRPFSTGTSGLPEPDPADSGSKTPDPVQSPAQPATPTTPYQPPANPTLNTIEADLQKARDAAANISAGISGLTGSTTTAPKTPAPVTAPTTPTTVPKTYNTLYDYYTGTSGSYNTWNSAQRLGDAAKAGITNYTGTADQNTQLLKYLTSR